MTIVWVLVSVIYSGHFINSAVPTLEFNTQEACERAIATFRHEATNKTGSVTMRCVRIEK